MKMIANTRMHGTVKQIASGRSCTTVQMELEGGGSIEAIATASQARRMRIKVGKAVDAIVMKDHKAHIAA